MKAIIKEFLVAMAYLRLRAKARKKRPEFIFRVYLAHSAHTPPLVKSRNILMCAVGSIV